MSISIHRPVVLLTLLAALIFLLDWLTPVILATWGLYMVVILLANRWCKASWLYPVIGVCTVLILLSLLTPKSNPALPLIAINRLLGIGAFWVLGYFLAQYRKSSAAMHRSLTRYSALFETAPIGISIVNSSGKIVETNRQAELILGISKQEHETRTLDAPSWKIIRPDGSPMPPAEYAGLRALQEKRRVDHVEMGVINEGGGLTWLSVTAAPIALAEEGAVVVYSDITERVQSERALAQLAAIVQSSEDPILSNDMAGTIASWNRSAANLYGYSAAEAIGQPASMLFAPEHSNEMAAILARVGDGQLLTHYQTQHVDRQGKRLIMSLTVSPVYDRSGCITGTSLIARDITLQNELEQSLHRLNTELEERVQQRTAALEVALEEVRQADQIKEAFLAAVSHELRTPLTGVLSVADSLELQNSGPLNERQQELVQMLKRSSLRLLEIINGILHYTKLLAGQAALRQDLCSLAELGENCIAKVKEHADRKQLGMHFVVEPPDLTIVGDSEGIAQLLYNLLDNAVKFTPECGAVGLEMRRIPDDQVSLVVWDTGIGIAEKHHERIFDAFVQADAGRARHYDGVGLGLTYAKRMAELLGGTCTVQSAPAGGSRFIVTLPLSAPARVDTPPA